jgi:two-component system, chemotaxis family, chemotaxis protein CheY
MKTILIVDDSATILISIQGILTKAGFNVEKAANGQEGLKMVQAKKPDLMITDLNMPILDGIGLISEVRKLPAARFMPILVLTTESQQAKRDQAKSAGATGWLVKPAKADELLSVIKRVLPGA